MKNLLWLSVRERTGQNKTKRSSRENIPVLEIEKVKEIIINLIYYSSLKTWNTSTKNILR